MDLSILRYFSTAAKTQHMTRAAQQLNITQPALSAAIRRLEAEVGFELFDRNGRGIQLNEYGEIFLKGVDAAEAAIAASLAEMDELRQGEVGFVRIACSISPINARLIDSLLERGIGLKAITVPDNWEELLTENECDLVITFGRPRGNELQSVMLRSQKIVVVAGKTHPLVRAESLTISDLHGYPFCSTSAPHSIINMAADQLRRYGLFPRITFLGRNSADLEKCIASGTRLGLMVEANLPKDGSLVVLPVDGLDLKLPIFLYWRRGGNQSADLIQTRQYIISAYQKQE